MPSTEFAAEAAARLKRRGLRKSISIDQSTFEVARSATGKDFPGHRSDSSPPFGSGWHLGASVAGGGFPVNILCEFSRRHNTNSLESVA